MRAASRLLNYSARLTLFTRQNCSLCDTAKQVVANVQKDKILDYSEIDVMAPGQEKWKDAYEFDTPVLHVQRVLHTYTKPDIVTEASKLMHRFSEAEVAKLIEETEANSQGA